MDIQFSLRKKSNKRSFLLFSSPSLWNYYYYYYSSIRLLLLHSPTPRAYSQHCYLRCVKCCWDSSSSFSYCDLFYRPKITTTYKQIRRALRHFIWLYYVLHLIRKKRSSKALQWDENGIGCGCVCRRKEGRSGCIVCNHNIVVCPYPAATTHSRAEKRREL